MKHLPKQLTYLIGRNPLPAEIRRGLTSRTGDDLARIVYNVTDSAQPMPHAGIVLKGRTVVGWIMSTLSFEDQGAESEGDLMTEHIEFFVPDPNGPAAEVLTCYESPYPSCYPELCRVRSELTANGGARDRREYDSRTTAELVKAIGMIEVIDERLLISSRLGRFNPERASVLMPEDNQDHWAVQSLTVARKRALQELRPPAFWNLPAQTVPLNWGDKVFSAVTLSPYLPDRESAHGLAVIVTGLIRLECSWVGRHGQQMKLTANRVNSGEGWRFELRTDAQRPPHSELYAIQSGGSALSVFDWVHTDGKLPARGDVIEKLQDARGPFDALILDAHSRRRRLQFVLDALNIDAKAITPRTPLAEPIPPMPAPPADGSTLH